MDRRTALISVLAIMVIAGTVMVSYPFYASLKISAKAEDESLKVIQIPDLVRGKIERIDVNGEYLFILKPSISQEESIEHLNNHVWSRDRSSYKTELEAYVYWGFSTKWGCPLKHKPPSESLIIEREESAVWLGGYWDDWCAVSYDYAGRTIKTYGYTYTGYNAELPNLRTPTVFRRGRHGYTISIIER